MKYRAKVTLVEAVQFDPTALPWPAGVLPYSVSLPMVGQRMGRLKVDMGVLPVSPGDWVLTYSNGTRGVLSDKEFHGNFELVKESHATDL